ncbi:hypothetical protein, partial [Streptomyces sp. OR43]|uniref:hypothetical protein n=1 Tax=Streptomyces sp. or43 TaxID=2478957 RepID=UPI0013A483F7
NTDPHGVFRWYDRLANRPGAPDRARAIAMEMRHALTARELKAAEHATPAPGDRVPPSRLASLKPPRGNARC